MKDCTGSVMLYFIEIVAFQSFVLNFLYLSGRSENHLKCYKSMLLIPRYDLLESRNVNIWDDFSVKRCVFRSLIEIFKLIMGLIKMSSSIFAILFIT